MFLYHFLWQNQPVHYHYNPSDNVKEILFTNDLYAAKHYLSG